MLLLNIADNLHLHVEFLVLTLPERRQPASLQRNSWSW